MAGDELTHQPAVTGGDAAAAAAAEAVAPGRAGWPAGHQPGRRFLRPVPGHGGVWLSIFAVSLGSFAVRLLVPSPVGLADNHDGLRLTCGLGVAPVTGGHPRWFSYAYFQFDRDPRCAGHPLYPSSQHFLLDAAKWLTPVLGLPGTLNLIALGLLACAIIAFGIASLATGLRLRPRAQLMIAAAVWLVMADAAFFGVYASPFSEGAALTGLLLVAAGAVYLARGWPAAAFGLALAGTGGALAIGSKEQYVPLVVPVCLTLVLASRAAGRGRRLRGLLTAQMAAAPMVAAALALLAAGYLHWDATSRYAATLHREQAVNVIFKDIIIRPGGGGGGGSTRPGGNVSGGGGSTRPGGNVGSSSSGADLRALGLPVSWARYAGHGYFSKISVRHDPLYGRYGGRLNAGNITHFLLTHPLRLLNIGQQAAKFAMAFRETYLGNYAPGAGHPPGALEYRVQVVSWLVRAVPSHLGLLWLATLWTVLAAIAIAALRRGVAACWHRDAAILVLCMTGCAIIAFVPPAYFDGSATTRHLLGSNLATALACPIGAALAIARLRQVTAGLGTRGTRGTRRTRGSREVPGRPPAGPPASPSGDGSHFSTE